MGKLLYLVHRLPYPPNKGDKVRSFHLLKHLTQEHRVFLGTFIDDPADEAYLDTVRALCPDLFVARLQPRRAKLRSLLGLLTGQSLSQHYYQNAGLQRWVQQTLAEHDIDAVVIFSSVMAQYIKTQSAPPMLVDFVDVDSAKWTQYAADHRWPLSWLYRREGERLLAYERSVAQRAQHSFFVTDNEANLFKRLAPENASKVDAISNGVDAEFFSPDPDRPSPFGNAVNQAPQIPLVFTGAMDYWPNIDAVTWFVADMLPSLRQQWPQLCFYIVGRSPPPAVQALAGPGVVVTGTVPDVRPYLQHAAVVVAPLRVARGIQNKILEAMAMARPVVASESCAQAIHAETGTDLLDATSPADFITQISALLASAEHSARVGAAGRNRVLSDYSWFAHLSNINTHLNQKASV
jgi:polysaccharide biosynthesis protein PslH